MTVVPHEIYRFNAIPITLPIHIFERTRTKNFTIYMDAQKIPNRQSNLEKEEWSWRNQLTCLQTIVQTPAIKTVWCWHKRRNIDEWNKIESPYIYGHLIFDREGRNI